MVDVETKVVFLAAVWAIAVVVIMGISCQIKSDKGTWIGFIGFIVFAIGLLCFPYGIYLTISISQEKAQEEENRFQQVYNVAQTLKYDDISLASLGVAGDKKYIIIENPSSFEKVVMVKDSQKSIYLVKKVDGSTAASIRE